MPASVAQSFALSFRSCSWFRCPAPGRFALRATAHRAGAFLRAFGVHAVQATCLSAARLRAGPIPGCSIIRASLTVALMVSLPSQISAFCALSARSPCICSRLRVALRCAQQPTGLTLPSGAPSPVPQHKKVSVASARRAQETRLAQPLPEYQRKRRGHPPPGGAAPPLFQKTLSLERPAFLAPFGRSQRSTGFAAGSAGVLLRLPASSRVSRVPVAQSFALP